MDQTNTQMPEMQELAFPTEYELINDEFEAKYADAIRAAGQRYAHSGGVMRLDAGERRIIVRIPSDETIKDVRKRTADTKMDPFDSDRMLIKQCLVYPSEVVLDRWMGAEGKTAICSSFAASLMEEVELNRAVVRKKY